MNPWESYDAPAGIPVDCSAYSNPSADTVDCQIEYKAHEGEITDIWLVPASFNPATGKYEAAATPVNWEYKGDLNAISGVSHFEVIGDKPLNEPREVGLPRFLTKIVERTHNINVDITHQSINNYNFVRFYQTPGLHAALWYADYGGHVFGGADGIIVWVPNAGNVHGRGAGTLRAGQLIFQWKHLFDPPVAILNSGGSAQLAGGPIPQRISARPLVRHTAPSALGEQPLEQKVSPKKVKGDGKDTDSR